VKRFAKIVGARERRPRMSANLQTLRSSGTVLAPENYNFIHHRTLPFRMPCESTFPA
jgi:hypothetical protein